MTLADVPMLAAVEQQIYDVPMNHRVESNILIFWYYESYCDDFIIDLLLV